MLHLSVPCTRKLILQRPRKNATAVADPSFKSRKKEVSTMKAMKKVLKKEKKQAPILLKPQSCFLDVVIVKKAQK